MTLRSEYSISKICSLTNTKKNPRHSELRDCFIRLLSVIVFDNLLHENYGEPLSLN